MCCPRRHSEQGGGKRRPTREWGEAEPEATPPPPRTSKPLAPCPPHPPTPTSTPAVRWGGDGGGSSGPRPQGKQAARNGASSALSVEGPSRRVARGLFAPGITRGAEALPEGGAGESVGAPGGQAGPGTGHGSAIEEAT